MSWGCQGDRKVTWVDGRGQGCTADLTTDLSKGDKVAARCNLVSRFQVHAVIEGLAMCKALGLSLHTASKLITSWV